MDEMIVPAEAEKISRVQSGWMHNLDNVILKIDEMEQLALNGRSRLALDLLYEVVPTFRPLDADTSESIRRREARKDAVRNWRVASQSI